MTDRHKCEWGPWHPWCSAYRCVYPGCYKNISSEEVAKRLNEYETLKEAAKWVLHVAHDIGKDGGIPSDEEKLACMNDLKDAYEASIQERK